MIVKYSKKFPYAPYLNEDIGFEESIMDGASEEEMLAALRKLSAVALKFHKENNPQIQFDPELCAPIQKIKWDRHEEPYLKPTPPPVIDRKAIERLEILIDDAKTIEELAIYKEEASKHGLVEQYMRRLKVLSKQTQLGPDKT